LQQLAQRIEAGCVAATIADTVEIGLKSHCAVLIQCSGVRGQISLNYPFINGSKTDWTGCDNFHADRDWG
jgi:hypothetical protein